MAGALTAVMLFPKTKSAIIILTNSLSLSDTPDWVSQLLSEIVFGMPEKHDYVQWTKRTVEVELS
jgi:hypothetical protein